jgi:hypothetical protein
MLCPVLVKMCKDDPGCRIIGTGRLPHRAINRKILNKPSDWIFSMVKMLQTNQTMRRRLGPLTVGVASLLLVSPLAIGVTPAQANWFKSKPVENGYKLCGMRLDKAGIGKDVAADACAAVLHPEDLGTCVADLTPLKLAATAALAACQRVRRPLELRTCVQDVQRQDANAVLPNVLEACRRSLLPERYGKCVVGLNQSVATPTAMGLATCLDASDRPIDIQSGFVPINDVCRLEGFVSVAVPKDCDKNAQVAAPLNSTGTSGVTPTPAPTQPAQLY